jgi:glycosidase
MRAVSFSRWLRILLLGSILAVGLGQVRPALAALGTVENMWPVGGSSTTITAGGSFDVYVQVFKAGVTAAGGQGANITCTLHWGQVASFGGAWSNITDDGMAYNTDNGNNDEYHITISPTAGLYEFTAFCTDTTDSSSTWQGAGNGRLTVNAPATVCGSATTGDNNIYWSGLLHDSFSTNYRSPIGPVTSAQGTVTLRFRTCQNDVTAANIRVWNDRTNTQTITPLTAGSNATEPGVGNVTYWSVNLPIPTDPTILYYVFSATDGSSTAYYRDDDPKFYGGGYGTAEGTQSVAYGSSYQLTVYDPAFSVPAWMQRGVVYQIFPERFRDGNPANDPAAGRFSYGGAAIARSFQANWNYTLCDPRNTYIPWCPNQYGDNFYGGDLAGITAKISDGYFTRLGVTVLYLNPIFRSPSNHKYDTANYLEIDPDFGTLADFQALVAAADAHGIRIILDGVFNHVSSDSTYFDFYRRYDSAGHLTSAGVGTDDNSGACESPASPYRNWFYIPDSLGSPATGPSDRCAADDASPWSLTYSAWYGYGSLPKLQANSAAVRNLIWNNGTNSVGPYWVNQGADGWRFDVGGDVDPGVTNDPANDYWEGFRSAVRSVNNQTLTLGEEWGDASAWLLGNEWDSVMNYRFRSTVLSWLFTGCSGNGCTGGTAFEDNDSNAGSSSGTIAYISPSQFNARLRSIQEDYPPMAFKAMMNLAGSHDTNRLRFLLKKINNDNDSAAAQRMKEWWLFAFTYAGTPTLYYGDEVGINHDGVWANSKWEDDPYNRIPFPWTDTPGSYSPDTTNLLPFARQMASIRHSYRALQDGDVQHGLIVDDANQLYGFARTNGAQTALIALNRSGSAHAATFSGLNAAPYNLADGTLLVNALNLSAGTYAVSGGSVTVNVSSSWGVILLEQSKIDRPVTPVGRTQLVSSVNIIFSPVMTDTNGGFEVVTAYHIYRGTTAGFTPGAGNLIATVQPSGLDNYALTYQADPLMTVSVVNGQIVVYDPLGTASSYYAVGTANAAGGSSVNTPSPTVVDLITLRSAPVDPVKWVLVGLAGLAVLGALGWLLWRRRLPQHSSFHPVRSK